MLVVAGSGDGGGGAAVALVRFDGDEKAKSPNVVVVAAAGVDVAYTGGATAMIGRLVVRNFSLITASRTARG